MSSTLVTMKGFAPKGLVARLKKGVWTVTDDGGENFQAITLGRYCLTRPGDKIMPYPFAVVVTDGETGEQFRVEGFGSRGLPLEMRHGSDSTRIFSHVLRRNNTRQPGERRLVEYTLELRAA